MAGIINPYRFGGGVPADPIFFNDEFNDTGGTLLTSHTPDTGSHWIKEKDSATYAPGEIDSAGTNLQIGHPTSADANNSILFSARATYPSANYSVRSQIEATGYSSTYPICLLARWVDLSNYYGLSVVQATAGMVLWKEVAGVVTVLDQYTGAIYAGSVLNLNVDGTSIKGYKNGVELVSATDSALTATGYACIGGGNIRVSSYDLREQAVRSFRVTDLG